MTRWICSRCGESHRIESAQPSIDARFAIGYCGCTPPPKPPALGSRRRQRDRERVQLVASAAWDPKVLFDRRQREADRRLLSRYNRGKSTEAEADQVRGLLTTYERKAAER